MLDVLIQYYFMTILADLKKDLTEHKIDFFILPNSDEFFSEYLPDGEKRVKYVTGFTGSNACVIIGQDKSYFFTDGRYTLQAKKELDLAEFDIINMGQQSVLSWLESEVGSQKRVGLDPKLSHVGFVQACQKALDDDSELVLLDENPIDQIWSDRPEAPATPAFFCGEKLVGLDSMAKRQLVLEQVKAEALLITKPENLCWLLNIRAADVEATPLLLAYGILFKDGHIDLFMDENRVADFDNVNLKNVNFVASQGFLGGFAARLMHLKEVQIDPLATNYWLYQLLQKTVFDVDPIDLMKACKNDAEIMSAIKSHEVDGVAVTKFLAWLDAILKKGEAMDELKASNQLLAFRQEHADFLYPSFGSISSFAGNGAIIHYQASEKTNKKFEGNSLYLIDSGGQYFGEDFCGTTDVTRTIAVGEPTKEMMTDFTLVLKGHIALANARFRAGTTGAELDILARSFLNEAGKDYEHGTGHGVGSFLSVHEGPCGISRRSMQALMPGMILSNEPGFYKTNEAGEGEYGIRIESLMLVEECEDDFLQFKTLTLVPIDERLIDFSMLNQTEKEWLTTYHARVDALMEKSKTH